MGHHLPSPCRKLPVRTTQRPGVLVLLTTDGFEVVSAPSHRPLPSSTPLDSLPEVVAAEALWWERHIVLIRLLSRSRSFGWSGSWQDSYSRSTGRPRPPAYWHIVH